MKTVKITLTSNGNSQIYPFDTNLEAKNFFFNKVQQLGCEEIHTETEFCRYSKFYKIELL